MILSTDYTSISLFGLCFIFVVGTLIIMASFIVEPILGCRQKRHKYKPYKLREWQTDETLQLQRLGYQGLEKGTWSHGTDSIPLPRTDELLEPLALLQGDLAEGDEPERANKKSGKMASWFKLPLWKRSKRSTEKNTESSSGDNEEQNIENAAVRAVEEPSEHDGSTSVEPEGSTTHQQSNDSALAAQSISSHVSTDETTSAQPQHPVQDPASGDASYVASAGTHTGEAPGTFQYETQANLPLENMQHAEDQHLEDEERA
jgi:hypothetical protein